MNFASVRRELGEYAAQEWRWLLLLTFGMAALGWVLYLGELDREWAMLESGLEEKIVTHAKQNGWVVRKVKWPGRAAAPDRLFMKAPGQLVFIEVKQAGEAPRALQERELQLLRRLGFTAVWVDSLEEAKKYLGE